MDNDTKKHLEQLLANCEAAEKALDELRRAFGAAETTARAVAELARKQLIQAALKA